MPFLAGEKDNFVFRSRDESALLEYLIGP